MGQERREDVAMSALAKPRPDTAFNPDAISRELRAMPNWVCWKVAIRDGRPTKIPVDPNTLRNANGREHDRG